MGKPPITTSCELGISKAALRIIADARLSDFDALWKAGHWHAAVYMAGYGVEAYLKCAICKTLKIDQLPRTFEHHQLEPLLFFSGFHAELMADMEIKASFLEISSRWSSEMRYEDPTRSKIDDKTCIDYNVCLNDEAKGLIPWLRKRL